MKIKLKVTLPILGKHGAYAGRIFDVVREVSGGRGENKTFFMGDAGEECVAFPREFEYVREKSDDEDHA